MGLKSFLSSPKRVAIAGLTGGLSETGLFDKKKTEADPLAEQLKNYEAKYAAKKMEALNEFDKQSSPEAVQSQIARENSALQGNLADIRRKVQQNIAKQGLQNSSLGQAAMVAPERQIGQQISLNSISAPERLRQLAMQKAQMAQSGQNIPLNFQQSQQPSLFNQLLPSLLQTGGTIAGSVIGGPAGGAVGGQAGSGLSSLTQQEQPYGGFGSAPYNQAYNQKRFRF